MKTLGLLALALMTLLGGLVLHILYSTGSFREIEDRNDFGPVYGTIDLPGVEDMAIARDDSVLVLSVVDRASLSRGEVGPAGIYLVDLRDPAFTPEPATDDLTFPFFPHGLSILSIEPGRYALAAINHVDGVHSVELFTLEDGALQHRRTISDPNFTSPNDLTLVDPARFYFTNDRGMSGAIGDIAEILVGVEASNVGFFDGSSARIVADDIGLSNGIQYDRSNRRLFVAAVRGTEVKVYDVGPDWDLDHVEDIDIGTGPDNIELDERGDLWIGSHPRQLAFIAYRMGRRPVAPSEVIRIDYEPGEAEVESIFTDTGELLSGSSVALPWGDYLFIGNVMDEEALILKR